MWQELVIAEFYWRHLLGFTPTVPPQFPGSTSRRLGHDVLQLFAAVGNRGLRAITSFRQSSTNPTGKLGRLPIRFDTRSSPPPLCHALVHHAKAGFKLLASRQSRLICDRCGHVVVPDQPEFECPCQKCVDHQASAGIDLVSTRRSSPQKRGLTGSGLALARVLIFRHRNTIHCQELLTASLASLARHEHLIEESSCHDSGFLSGSVGKSFSSFFAVERFRRSKGI